MASLGLIGMAGGLGGQMVKEADEERKMSGLKDFETWKMGVLQELKMQDEGRAESRQIAAEKRKVDTADQLRVDQAGRIDAKAGELADTAVAGKRGLVDSGIADREAWTPEQQAAVDQSLALDRSAIASDGRTREKAGVLTGDISPEKAAVIDRDERRLDITEKSNALKDKAAERRDETNRYIAELKDETAQKRIEALLKKTGSDKSGTREALSFIDGVRKDLASEAQNLKALYAADTKDLSTTKRDAVKAEYAPKFAAIEAKRTQIENDFNALREKVGLPSAGGSTPAKPAASDAKPKATPYPEGTRLTGPGGKRYIVRNGQPVPE